MPGVIGCARVVWVLSGVAVLWSCGPQRLTAKAVEGLDSGLGVAAGDAGDAAPADADNGVEEERTLVMVLPEVEPSEEVYFCQNFGNRGEDVERYVQSFESHASTGLHHLLLFYKEGVEEDGPAERCSPLEFDIAPFGAQSAEETVAYPPGVAMQVPKGVGFRLQLQVGRL